MSRLSGDEYRMADGSMRTIGGNEQVPAGATLINGYDYGLQKWVEDGVVIENLAKWRSKAERKAVRSGPLTIRDCGDHIDISF